MARPRLVALILSSLHALAVLADITCEQQQIPPGNAPVAMNDVAFIANASVTVPVLQNDQYAGTPSVVGLTPCPQQVCTTITTASGGTARIQSNTVIYTPPATPVADSFDYAMTDSAQPNSSATARVSLLLAGAVTIDVNCTVASCAFRANPPLTTNIRRYVWNWGDGSGPQPWPQEITHLYDRSCSPNQYPCTKTYEVSVTVEYWDGRNVTGQRQVTLNLRADPSWILFTNGLDAGILQVDTRFTLPDYTRASAMLSPNTADCADVCGTWGSIELGSSAPQVTGRYQRSGTYRATLRFDPSPPGGPQVPVIDYTIFITVQNKAPVPGINYSRPNLHQRRLELYGVHSDDGPVPYAPYQWEFGDGATYIAPQGQTYASHPFTNVGTYNVSLKVRDGEGLSGTATKVVQVENTPPVAGITVSCGASDCTFSADATLDDGGPFQSLLWTFDDGTTSKLLQPTKQYPPDPDCRSVALQLVDAEGLPGNAQLRFAVGTSLMPQVGGIVSDAHVQSFQSSGQWQTSDGDLNGILEPGETAVIEPRWPYPAQTFAPLFVNWNGLTSTDSSYAGPQMRAVPSSYSVASGFSDCRAGGGCYVVKLLTGWRSQYAPDHNDVSFQEREVSSGLPTPGSPITIHVGKSFNDVPKTHWAYPFVESLLHLGIVAGCGVGEHNYCPETRLTRADIASWLLKAKHGAAWQPPSCVEPGPFNDVPCSHPAAAWIQQLKNDGLTSGTGGGNYSPSLNLSRAELTIFALRTKLGAAYAPPACTADFADVQCPGYWAANWISDAKARGISNGCSPHEYCPAGIVDRAQAAAMLARAFNLRIDVTACPSAPAYDVVPGYASQAPITSITFNPPYVLVGGGQSTGTIQLRWAPGARTSIPLSVDKPGSLTVPAQVWVEAGQTTGTFTVNSSQTASPTTVQVSATYFGVAQTVPLAICTAPTPAINTQPQSRAINLNDSTTLTVVATGAASYQWYRGAAPSTSDSITGATQPSLSVMPSTTTSYWVGVTNACGTTASATATITVCKPPNITQHPTSDVILPNESATLTVEATGSDPLTYQWYEGQSGNTAVEVHGATSSTFITPLLTASKWYWVRVKSTCNGTVVRDSNAAEVAVVTKMTRRQDVLASNDGSPSVTATWPRGDTRAGTLLVAIITQSGGDSIAEYDVPAGWILADTSTGNLLSTSTYYIPNNAGDRSVETFQTRSPNGNPNTRPNRALVLFLAEYVGGWIPTLEIPTPLDRTARAHGAAPNENGEIWSGTTAQTAQLFEMVITAVAIKAETELESDKGWGFTEIGETFVPNQFTVAIHERVTYYQAQWALNVAVGDGKNIPEEEWVGAVATFRSAIAHAGLSEGEK